MRKDGLLAALVFAVAAGAASVPANATTVSINVGQIVRLQEYVTFGNGDVAVWTQTTASGCDGFWFRTTELNGKEIFAHLLAAHLAQESMNFTVYDDQLWSGTGSRFCRIYSVGEN